MRSRGFHSLRLEWLLLETAVRSILSAKDHFLNVYIVDIQPVIDSFAFLSSGPDVECLPPADCGNLSWLLLQSFSAPSQIPSRDLHLGSCWNP